MYENRPGGRSALAGRRSPFPACGDSPGGHRAELPPDVDVGEGEATGLIGIADESPADRHLLAAGQVAVDLAEPAGHGVLCLGEDRPCCGVATLPDEAEVARPF